MRKLFALVSPVLLAATLPASALAADSSLYQPAVEYQVVEYGVSPTAEAIATGDFTGDGHADVVVTDEYQGVLPTADNSGVVLLPGLGDGTLGTPARFATGQGADAVSAGDLDCDGALDLVVSNGISGTVSLLFGHGAGGFTETAEHPAGSAPGSIAIGDFNTDGRPDFAVAANPSYLFLGAGDRGFTGRDLGVGSSVVGLGADDLNGDGALDLVIGDGFPAKLHVLLGNGDGTFTAPVSYPVPGWVQEAFRVGDVNADATPDVVAVNSEGVGSILLGGVGGTLAPAQTFDSGWGSDGLEIADLNADGKVDLAINESGSSDLVIHLGDGTGGFSRTEAQPVVQSAESVAVVDLDENGKPDLVAAPFFGKAISVLIHA